MDSTVKLKKRMPPDWKPPAPGWAADFSEIPGTIVTAYFGSQIRSPACAHYQIVDRFLNVSSGPGNVEHARFVNREGHETIVSVGYWANLENYERWRTSSGFNDWWTDPARAREPNGYLLEVLKVPTDRFETIFSTWQTLGVGKVAAGVTGPVREHNYWGSMRDRIAKSATDELASQYGTALPRSGNAHTLGRRVRVRVPGNIAVIRSGQDWTDCGDAELTTYDESVRPALEEAMAFLRDHPDETGCCDLRFAQETDARGVPLKRSFGLGYFLTLGHLEQWAASHPTHLAIFARFIAMLRQYKFKVDLRLWHEVSVLPQGDQTFEYINCDSATGLLPYFPAED
jgi:aldoxime dehydratase